MEFSKSINEYCTIYALQPAEVALAILVDAGWKKHEAVCVVMPPNPPSDYNCRKLADKLWTQKAGLSRLVTTLGDNRKALQEAASKRKAPTVKWTEGQFRDKNAVLDALEQEAMNLQGKEKVDALMKIADLQRMKQEENQTEEETIHYFLPLECKRCPLMEKFENGKK